MKANQHGVLICRVCNQNKERRSQVYRGERGDYVLGRAIHRQMVEGVKKLPQSTPLPAFGPGRKHSLLPALAKNMPPAYFLNASRPLRRSLLIIILFGFYHILHTKERQAAAHKGRKFHTRVK